MHCIWRRFQIEKMVLSSWLYLFHFVIDLFIYSWPKILIGYNYVLFTCAGYLNLGLFQAAELELILYFVNSCIPPYGNIIIPYSIK